MNLFSCQNYALGRGCRTDKGLYFEALWIRMALRVPRELVMKLSNVLFYLAFIMVNTSTIFCSIYLNSVVIGWVQELVG